jgi:hypothetical protein
MHKGKKEKRRKKKKKKKEETFNLENTNNYEPCAPK